MNWGVGGAGDEEKGEKKREGGRERERERGGGCRKDGSPPLFKKWSTIRLRSQYSYTHIEQSDQKVLFSATTL